MKINFYPTKLFEKALNGYLRKRRILESDYRNLKDALELNPYAGDVVQGAGGLCKIRMKSNNQDKSGGFRVCYFYFKNEEVIYLLDVYVKNEKEDLDAEEKRYFKALIHEIKKQKTQ